VRGLIVSAPIFISYSSKDQEIAETIYQALEARGLDCWIACRDVRPGENFQEAIVKALRSAKVMLLLFTSNANNSDEIKKELVLAGRNRVTVVPVRVEDVVPSDAFSYEFATRQWIDLFKDWEREIEQLALQLGHVLATAKPADGGAAEASAPAVVLPPRRAVKTSSSNQPLIWGAVAVVALIVIGGAVFYLRPSAKTLSAAAPPPAQTAAPAPPVQTAAPTPPPEPPPAPKLSPDETAWQTAQGAATIAAFRDYLKAFPAGAHAQEAELQIADLTLAAPTIKSKNFDGTWLTTYTCASVGPTLGYSNQFSAQVKDGEYHGLKGKEGERGSLSLDGKIAPDGTAAFLGKGVVGSSAFAVGGVQAGTQFFFHVLAQFDRANATGKRVEGRPCSVTFLKQ
jgi:hypothetical protein